VTTNATRSPEELSDHFYGIGLGPGWLKQCTKCNAFYPCEIIKCPHSGCNNQEFSVVQVRMKNTIATTFACGLKFDSEFRELIEPLTEEERSQLTANLLREKGAHDPIIAWKGHDIVLDGHNRLEICDDNKLFYTVVPLDLPDREACKAWIIGNQLGRRNLSPQRMDYLRGKKLELEKGQRGGKKIPPSASKGAKVQNEPLTKPPAKQKPADTAARIAEETGVSRATVKRNGKFTSAVDKLAHYAPALRQELLSGQRKMSNRAATSIGKMNGPEIETLSRALEKNPRDPVEIAIREIARDRFFAPTKKPEPAAPTASRKTKAEKRETPAAVSETGEAWTTVLNRLTEIKDVIGSANFRGVRTRVLDLIKFVESQQ
jgi:hypothetical protein